MADIVFNIAKGRFVEWAYRVDTNDPANSALIVVALKTVAADATLKDQATLAAVLSGGSVEATNVNYARKTLTDVDIASPIVDNTNDWYDVTIPNLTWGTPPVAAAGGAWVALLLCYDSDTTSGTDTNILPISKHDFAITPDGTADIVATITAPGLLRDA